jgi:hypothetical protein
MNPFYRPHYVSDTTDFIAKLKSDRPQLEAEQRAGRALLWDKPADAPARQELEAGRVAQQAYVYHNKA